VGIVQVAAVNDPEAETLALAGIVQLDPTGMETVRIIALDLEKRAYKVSPELYGLTQPMEQIPPP
jgi:hypothetical protein